MSRLTAPSTRTNLSVVLSLLAILLVLAAPAQAALGKGVVKAKNLADGAVKTVKIRDAAVTSSKLANGAVTASKLANGAVGGAQVANGSLTQDELADGAVDTDAVLDRSIRLHDLGGGLTDQTVTFNNPIAIAANDCRPIGLRLFNPAPAGLLGSLVVGNITTSTGDAVVNNAGSIVPTLVTETSQGGALLQLVVCAGTSAQTIPTGSVATFSVIAP
jgi:hypothetical protein